MILVPLPHRSVSVPLRQLQFGPQICDDYPGCPSRSDSSDEMSELDVSEVDDISKDDDELLFLAKRFFDLLPVPRTRSKSDQAVNMDVYFAGT